jgi:hypothetical protein
MRRRLAWYGVLGMAGLAVGCGRVTLQEPGRDGGPVEPPVVDARPSEPRIDAATPPPSDAGAEPGPLDPTLLAWYPLDGVGDGFTVDATGNGHDARCVPDPSRCPDLVEGRRGRAMDFNAIDHLRVSGEDGFFDTYDGFTIAAWVLLAPPLPAAPLGKVLGADTSNSWQLEMVADGTPAFTTATFGDNFYDFAGLPLEFETWVHLAGSWDGFTKRFYIDGTLVYALDDHLVDFDGSDVLIGGDADAGEPAVMFGGLVDDVRIYGRALEDGEVAALAAP